jgi:hypothetical protein
MERPTDVKLEKLGASREAQGWKKRMATMDI